MAKKFSKFVLFTTIAAGAAAYFYYRRTRDEEEFFDDFDDFDLEEEDGSERTYVNLGEEAEKAAEDAGLKDEAEAVAEAAGAAAEAASDVKGDLKEKAAVVGRKVEKKAGEIAKGTKAALKGGIEAVKKAADNVKSSKDDKGIIEEAAEDIVAASDEKGEIPISDGEDLFDDTDE